MVALAAAAGIMALPARAADDAAERLKSALANLVAAYPEHLDRIEGNVLVWKDGTRMTIDDGRRGKSAAEILSDPDIKDMLATPYPAGAPPDPPARDVDPGRARFAPLFDKMYGDCSKGEVARNLADVVWLPGKAHQHLKVTRINGVAERLAAVSRKLDALPRSFDVFLFPSAGTINCRPIAGTTRISAHGHGIAIDLATARSSYWRWAKAAAGGAIRYHNRMPMEIVRAFESEGFIWGGRWYHYDTMHFEYRPELLPRRAQD